MPKGKTIGDVQKETGVKLNANPNMRIATWFERNGFPSLGKAMRIVEKQKISMEAER